MSAAPFTLERETRAPSDRANYGCHLELHEYCRLWRHNEKPHRAIELRMWLNAQHERVSGQWILRSDWNDEIQGVAEDDVRLEVPPPLPRDVEERARDLLARHGHDEGISSADRLRRGSSAMYELTRQLSQPIGIEHFPEILRRWWW